MVVCINLKSRKFSRQGGVPGGSGEDKKRPDYRVLGNWTVEGLVFSIESWNDLILLN